MEACFYFGPKCDKCQEFRKIRESSACVESELSRHSIFAHGGKLIYYIISGQLVYYCKTCRNPCRDCVYIKDSNYYTLFEDSVLTVINCEITRALHPTDSYIMESDLGTFIVPKHRTYNDLKVLFLRGIKIKYVPFRDRQIFYPKSVGEPVLQNFAFASLISDDANVYLIDKNGSALMYETLFFIGRETSANSLTHKIFVNDIMRVKIWGQYEKAEILTDKASVGKLTNPALRVADD